MNKCIVLGIDAPLSPATQQAIRTIKELIGPMAPQFRLILLHVIALPYVTSPALGMYAGQLQSNLVSADQRQEAEKILARVRGVIQEQALDSLRIDICIRQGSPSDEILRVAREVHADLVIVGSRGNAGGEQLRRFLMGSKSRRVLQGATCPVMIVSSPSLKRPSNLVSWYEEAITRHLREHPSGLTVFSPGEVAQLFAPPGMKKGQGRKERAAAAQALEHLSQEGVLCRHEVKGELKYVND
jgi:nucleotide-binding universal stress UspA family protein